MKRDTMGCMFVVGIMMQIVASYWGLGGLVGIAVLAVLYTYYDFVLR